MGNLSISGDTYHNRHSLDSKYSGNKKYKKLPKKCSVCGSTKGPFDLHHTSNNRKDLRSGKGLKVVCRSCHRKYHAKLNGGRGEFIEVASIKLYDSPDNEKGRAIAREHSNSDLMYVDFILCHEGGNKNYDYFTDKEIKENANTAINKPINMEHTIKNIGVIYDSKYVEVASLKDEEKDFYKSFGETLEKNFIICKGVIWQEKHPKEAREIRKEYEEGILSFSMENQFKQSRCSNCNEIFNTSFEYCDHLLERRQVGSEYYGTFREFIGSNFIGAAKVKKPADPSAKGLAIAKNQSFVILLPYYIKIEDYKLFVASAGEFSMQKIDIPIRYRDEICGTSESDVIPNEEFADDVNRGFPINNEVNLIDSAKIVFNEELKEYSKSEQVYILQRLSEAAAKYEINLNDYIEEKGEETMTQEVYKTKEEFDKALATEIDKVKNGDKIKESETTIASLKEEIKNIKEDNTKISKEKEAVAKELEDYKKNIEAEKNAEARYSELSNAGLTFDGDELIKIKQTIKEMSDEAFASFKSVLVKAKEIGEAKFLSKEEIKKEEEKKKLAEDKKKSTDKKVDKKDDSKADIVDESKKDNEAVANLIENEETEDKFAIIDTILSK